MTHDQKKGLLNQQAGKEQMSDKDAMIEKMARAIACREIVPEAWDWFWGTIPEDDLKWEHEGQVSVSIGKNTYRAYARAAYEAEHGETK